MANYLICFIPSLPWIYPFNSFMTNIILQSKSMGWFLYDRNLSHERVNAWCPQKGHTYLNKPIHTFTLFKNV